MINQNITWFYKKKKKDKLGVNRFKIPQIQIICLIPPVQAPHTQSSHDC